MRQIDLRNGEPELRHHGRQGQRHQRADAAAARILHGQRRREDEPSGGAATPERSPYGPIRRHSWADAKAGRNPYYAVGFRITSADADTILLSKSFEVIAVRYENKLFGNYYHGGETQVVDAQGEELSKEVYPTAVPSDEGTHGIYTLTTDAPDALTTNYIGTKEGSVRLTLDGKEIRVSGSVDGSQGDRGPGEPFQRRPVAPEPETVPPLPLSERRRTFTVVRDTLTVPQPHPRRRERVADENPKNYD